MNRLHRKLVRLCNEKIFSACAVGIFRVEDEGTERLLEYVGRHGRHNNSRRVDNCSLFDLASLTKPLVGYLSLLSLEHQKKVKFSDPLSAFPFSIAPSAEKRNITLEQLLSHVSGLPAHREYFRQLGRKGVDLYRKNIEKAVLLEKLQSSPGTTYIYSDLDYMIVGWIVEKITRKPLGQFWRETIVHPMGLDDEFHVFGEGTDEKSHLFVETGSCPWSHKPLKGLVHDDNCRPYGAMMGHAGLFGTLPGVVQLCETLLQLCLGRAQHPSLDSLPFVTIAENMGKGRRVCGFDSVSGDRPSSGKYFSEKTIGHLGFTGTSFWIDLKKRAGVVLLTNRVIYGSDMTGIRKCRPEIHDTIMEEMERPSFFEQNNW